MEIRQVPGASAGRPLEVSPEAQPMSEGAISAKLAQIKREQEQLEQIQQRHEAEKQAERERLARVAQEREQAAKRKAQEQQEERERWAAINAQAVPSGHEYPNAGIAGIDRVVICNHPIVPMLVDDTLVVQDLELDLPIFELVSPVLPQSQAMLVAALYLDEVTTRWEDCLARTRATLGDLPWCYTSALPDVELIDAGQIVPGSGRPSSTHKIVRATWGDIYLHNPSRRG